MSVVEAIQTGDVMRLRRAMQAEASQWFVIAIQRLPAAVGANMIRELLSFGRHFNMANSVVTLGSGPLSLLSIAAGYNRPSVVRMLIDAGADKNAGVRHINGVFYRPVDVGALHGATAAMAELFRGWGVDLGPPEGPPLKNETPLMRAVMREHLSTVRLLLRNHADVRPANAGGNTALHFAARGSTPAIWDTLWTEHNADPNVPNNGGFTPMDIAGMNPNLAGLIQDWISPAPVRAIRQRAPGPPSEPGARGAGNRRPAARELFEDSA